MRNHSAFLDHPVGFARGPSRTDKRLFDPVTATIGAAGIIGGTSLLGSKMSSDASKSAANTQSDAANHAADLQQQNLQQIRQSLQPFINGGYDAQGSLRSLLGLGTPDGSGNFGSLTKPFDAAEFAKYQDPGYQFQLQQGQQALQNSQAAKDGVLSGGALKDLIGFNQGMASTAYQGAFGRYMSQNDATYNRLSNLLGIGENAAAGMGNTSAQVTSNIGNTLMSGANAQAAGQIGSANAWNSGLNNMGSYYMLSKMTGMGGGAGGGMGGFEPQTPFGPGVIGAGV
jgi:hypothetical protein